MTPTEELVAHLKKMEGFVDHPYLCAAGKLTVGYGHCITEAERAKYAKISEKDATALLLEDIAKYTMLAANLSPVLKEVSPRRLNAIIDFCFNCGGAAYAQSTLRRKVNVRQWADAANENDRWVYVTNPKTKVKAKSAWQIKRRATTSAWIREG